MGTCEENDGFLGKKQESIYEFYAEKPVTSGEKYRINREIAISCLLDRWGLDFDTLGFIFAVLDQNTVEFTWVFLGKKR